MSADEQVSGTLSENVLDLADAGMAAPPRYLMIWAAVYLLCGIITAALHFKRKQKSLSSASRMINNVILTLACFFFIPQLFLLSVLLLSATYRQSLLYLLILPAAVMPGIVQRGGYVPEERNTRAAQKKDT